MPGANLERSIQPILAEPIKLKKATLGSVIIFSDVGISQATKRHHCGGNPASCKISTNALHDNGVSRAGFTNTGQPAAIAGAT